MIAEHETKIFRSKLGIRNAELLPMSLPDETLPLRTRDWCENGVLRMLHVGSPDAMIGYYSLKFILEEVMPHIPDAIRSKLELIVAGKNQDTEYSRIIRKLAGPYPQVKFIGYVDDLLPLYGDSDVQLVGSSTATGLRTRIIESFVRGVPVLSTSAAAEGIVGLRDGHNIFLADSSELFAGRLISLQKDPSLLPILSENGRALYQTNYSRKVTAERLCTLLEQYL
jgi:glycosyltransferase involved in cell wall biosynthesis